MKKLQIEVRIPEVEEDKLMSGIKTSGFSDENIFDQLALLGIMENLKTIIHDRIKKLADVKGKV